MNPWNENIKRRTGPRKPLTPEKQVQNAVITYLKINSWMVQRNQQGLGNTKGRPDVEAYKHGFCLMIEFKAPKGIVNPLTGRKSKGGHVSDNQRAYNERLKAAGITIWIVDNAETFLEDLEKLQEKMWGERSRRLL